MEENNFRLPVDYIGKIAVDNNTHFHNGIKKGTKFRIRTVFSKNYLYHYMVEFYPLKKYEKLNYQGPFIKNEDIELTKAIKVLYG